jgi:sugar transferase (PEP-CTERM/EpsH1 system associated)
MPHRSRPDLLYLVHRVPYPPDKGDRIRTFNILHYLSGRAAVHLACLADEPVGDETLAALRRLCARVAVVPLGSQARWVRALGALLTGRTVSEGAFRSPALFTTLRGWARDTRFHACLASASSLVPYLRTPELRDVPAVIDLIDVDSQKWFDYAAAGRGPKAWLYRTEGRRLRRLEQSLPSWARALTLVSEAEVGLFRAFCPADNVHAVANGVDLEYFRPQPPAAGQDCVFVGALDYPPNIDGACWFCRDVWPRIRQARPHAKLRLVGRRPVPAVRALAGVEGVEVVGQVPDVRPFLAGAAVSLVPLRIARGVQNKTLEALAMAKAVVASPPSLAGIRAEPGVHLLAAASAAEWVATVVRLLDDEPLRRRLGVAGRRFVEEHHHWDRCLEPFGSLLGLEPADLPAGAEPAALAGKV